MAQRLERTPVPGRRKAEVLGLAAELFARDGYASTTVRDIADAAGILSGSLYHHFPSKEAIADAIISPLLSEVLTSYEAIVAAGGPPREAFEALANASLMALERHRAAAVVYEQDRRQLAALPRLAHLADAERTIERAWTTVLERGIADGEFRGGLDARIAYHLIRETIFSVARWHVPGEQPDLERISDQYLRILLDGVVRAKRKKERRD
ncbi:TetR/AcrR family transcriptional regulator [Conexibacter sp. CPCC 206217]|uniref:TetR/AcrR family transcriptional regulator n=1 Tax=Conexibacter sp. CPCC 206217 TaxID=3064574 RepID=UPI00271F90DE|nr:TetR/AcrR family transcriptional regulator [Conexibacter sp. CPCC 206217]MDO8211287.1 TetR/AcrR family transcriptional regulator [Conexibacter sp. CPCC 206217]